MHYKTCFISDLHLGCNKSEVDIIYSFLKENEFTNLYLVGDIIDIERIKYAGFLNPVLGQKHINIIQRILKLAKKGTKVNYIYGNHDELSNIFGEHNDFGNIKFMDEAEYVTSSNKKYLIIHGHQFDIITKYSPLLVNIGDRGYEFMIWLNKKLNNIRMFFGYPYWSLSKYIKHKFKNAVNFISNFSEAVANYTEHKKCDGVICGHVHHADSKIINKIHYMNTGCWTDKSNCTAIIEDDEGNLKIIYGYKNI